MKRTILLFFSLAICFSGIAQKPEKIKWGKVSKEEWKMTVCPFDSTAEAIILSDVASLRFRGSDAVIFRHKRIKLLNKRAFKYADIDIPFYHYKNTERVVGLKAQTLIRLPNGKVKTVAVSNKEEFEETINEYWGRVRFSFPAVEEGVIIEYKYEFNTSNIYFLEPWYFQNELPTRYSDFSVFIPESLDYNAIKIGRRIQEYYSKKDGNQWILRDLPGFRNEKMVFQTKDYADQIRFQLSAYRSFENGITKTVGVLKDWEDLSEQMMEAYIGFTRKDKAAQSYLEEHKLLGTINTETLQKIVHHIQTSFSWDQFNSIYLDQRLKEFLEVKKGNTAELNLWCYLLLKTAGFEVKPVLISTRRHGKLVKNYPLLSQFNRVVNQLKIGEELYYIDVTPDPIGHPYFLTPRNDLNYFGLLLDGENSGLIELDHWPRSQKDLILLLDLAGKSELLTRYDGYFAIDQLASEKAFWDGKEWNLFGQNLRFAFENGKNKLPEHGKLEIRYQVEQQIDESGGYIYLSPIDISDFKEIPFQETQERSFPVEFDFPFVSNIQLRIKKTDTYQLEELPKAKSLHLPDRKGRFTYSVKELDDEYMLIISVQVKEAIFPAYDYSVLREFYKQIREKLSEPIVFKKI